MRIAIIGGGIGGLTAALALRQFGFEPQVFEQAPNLLEVGAAILMWPNAMRVLSRLGLATAIRDHGEVLEKAQWLRCDGKLLNRFRLPKSDVPAVALHRADLQHTLVQALPQDTIHLGQVFKSYEQLPDQIIAHFDNASSVTCDVLVAADGIHSQARMQLLNDGPPTEHSYAAWRGVVPHTPSNVMAGTATEIYGRGQRFGFGPLGFGKVGWWASTNKSLMRDHRVNPGSETGALAIRDELLRLFADWHEPVLDLIQATPLTAFVRNGVFDRSPITNWGTDRVTLLGDAIHPITPNLGQGGGLAIEDAAILARCFEKYVSPEHLFPENTLSVTKALHSFSALRRDRAAAVARYSRFYGVIGQWEGRLAVGLRDRILSLVPNVLTERFLRGVFDYDAYAVSV
ncbi:MAG TPA: FAD-dependent monooxygenase [Pyrinomonadaceae bacterium]|nr:FAD-dependent monooxygenase [Pyrinomonadaceae bacterium]